MKSHKCDHNYYHTEDGVNCAAHSQHSLLAVVTNRAILIKNWLQKYILACWFVCHCFLIRSLNYWKHPQSFTDWHNWTDQHYKSTPSNITDGSESFFFLFFSSHSPGPKRNKMDTSVTVSSKCKGQSHKTMSINKNFEEKLSQCTQRLCFGKIYIIIYIYVIRHSAIWYCCDSRDELLAFGWGQGQLEEELSSVWVDCLITY